MKTPGTSFRVVVNREHFASAVIDSLGQIEISLVNQPGTEGAFLTVTASTSSFPRQSDTRVLTAGDSVAITLEARASTPPMIAFRSRGMSENPQPDDPLFFSFCGKEKLEAQKMVAGPNVMICDQCIEMCHEVVHET